MWNFIRNFFQNRNQIPRVKCFLIVAKLVRSFLSFMQSENSLYSERPTAWSCPETFECNVHLHNFFSSDQS